MAQEIGTSTLMDTWASGGTSVAPDINKIEAGWLLSEQPPHEYMNWLFAELQKKMNHLMAKGAPDWNGVTSFGAGAIVGYNGSIWQALFENTNSAPSVGNANWMKLWGGADFQLVARAMPHLQLPGNQFNFTVDGSNITIDAGQSWIWRNLRVFFASNFSHAERTFSIPLNTKNHIYWHAPGTGIATPAIAYPNGRFELMDLTAEHADGSNWDTTYDGDYDRMVVAGVHNNGGQINVFRTINRAGYHGTLVISRSGIAPANASIQTGSVSGLLLPRAPIVVRCGIVSLNTASMSGGGFSGADDHDHDRNFQISNVYRGGFDWSFLRDYAINFAVEVHLVVES